MSEKRIILDFSIEEANALVGLLGQIAYQSSAAFIHAIQAQSAPQLAAMAPEEVADEVSEEA